MKRYSTLLVYQGIANQKSQWDTLHTYRDGCESKKQKITSAGKTVEKLETLCLIDGNVKWCGCCGKRYDGSSKY